MKMKHKKSNIFKNNFEKKKTTGELSWLPLALNPPSQLAPSHLPGSGKTFAVTGGAQRFSVWATQSLNRFVFGL